MIATAEVTVTNPSGLHARPATELVRVASALSSSTQLVLDDRTIDARSVLSVMGAAIAGGRTLTVRCEGEQADLDLQTVVAAFAAGLGE
ncbi:HPr family phosphocarrier protein [Cellulomonas soli]|uniref:HPr family phosphocarrier protein n=1 Tax=Cellulomonas soli TaxID=931535 RepID=UPI003F86AA7D